MTYLGAPLEDPPKGSLRGVAERGSFSMLISGLLIREHVMPDVRSGSNSAVRRYAGLVREASESGHLETGGQCRRSAKS
jgi:hypothetical protein